MPLTCTMATLWAQKGRDPKPSQYHVLRKAKTKDQVPVLFTLEHSFSILGLPSYQVEQKMLSYVGRRGYKSRLSQTRRDRTFWVQGAPSELCFSQS